MIRRSDTDATFNADHGILTVGELRQLITRMDDDRHVVISTHDWYVNVDCVIAPRNDDSEYQCLTFFPGVEFDARQY
jgi:hypothetical protein